MGEFAGQTLKIGKNPIAPLIMQLVQGRIEKNVVIHDVTVSPRQTYPPRDFAIRAEFRGNYFDPDQETGAALP